MFSPFLFSLIVYDNTEHDFLFFIQQMCYRTYVADIILEANGQIEKFC